MALAKEAAPETVPRLEEAWGSHDLQAGRALEAVQHFQQARALGKAAGAAVQAGDVGLAGSLLDQMVRAGLTFSRRTRMWGVGLSSTQIMPACVEEALWPLPCKWLLLGTETAVVPRLLPVLAQANEA